jgi:hypothetical protein
MRKSWGTWKNILEILGDEIFQIWLRNLDIKVVFGIGCPAATAWTTGILWGALTLGVKGLSQWLDTRGLQPKLDILPQFENKSGTECRFHCILQMPLDHIIIAFWRWGWYALRIKTGRR